MFFVEVDKVTARLVDRETTTTGSQKIYSVAFSFSDDWDGYVRNAIFKAGDCGTGYIVPLPEENICDIPWEVFVKENRGKALYIGVYGVKDDYAMPTVWVNGGYILSGAYADEFGKKPTPGLLEQFDTRLQALSDAVDTLTDGLPEDLTDVMLKTTYDSDRDSVVDRSKNSEESNHALSSTSAETATHANKADDASTLNGKSDEDFMLVDVYDTDFDNVVEEADHALLADTATEATHALDADTLGRKAASEYMTKAEHVDPDLSDYMRISIYDTDSDNIVEEADHALTADVAEDANKLGGLNSYLYLTSDTLDIVMTKSEYDSDGDGIVDSAKEAEHATSADDATKLGGQEASEYLTKADKIEIDLSDYMKISVYDTDSDNVVEDADHAASADVATNALSLGGKSVEEFLTADSMKDVMLKSVYDSNGNGKVDSTTLADTASEAAHAANASKLNGKAADEYMLGADYDTDADHIVEEADHALSADDSTKLGGIEASKYVTTGDDGLVPFEKIKMDSVKTYPWVRILRYEFGRSGNIALTVEPVKVYLVVPGLSALTAEPIYLCSTDSDRVEPFVSNGIRLTSVTKSSFVNPDEICLEFHSDNALSEDESGVLVNVDMFPYGVPVGNASEPAPLVPSSSPAE